MRRRVAHCVEEGTRDASTGFECFAYPLLFLGKESKYIPPQALHKMSAIQVSNDISFFLVVWGTLTLGIAYNVVVVYRIAFFFFCSSHRRTGLEPCFEYAIGQ
jgi:hypothetical protein